MNKIITHVNWYCERNGKTIYIAARSYNIDILNIYPTETDNEYYAVIQGSDESVNNFLDDVDDDSILPFETTSHLSDDEYEDWLTEEFKKLNIQYTPVYE